MEVKVLECSFCGFMVAAGTEHRCKAPQARPKRFFIYESSKWMTINVPDPAPETVATEGAEPLAAEGDVG